MGARCSSDDDLNRASVELVERFRGHVVNERANENAKVEALSNTNSKAKDHASVGEKSLKPMPLITGSILIQWYFGKA